MWYVSAIRVYFDCFFIPFAMAICSAMGVFCGGSHAQVENGNIQLGRLRLQMCQRNYQHSQCYLKVLVISVFEYFLIASELISQGGAGNNSRVRAATSLFRAVIPCHTLYWITATLNHSHACIVLIGTFYFYLGCFCLSRRKRFSQRNRCRLFLF